MPDQWRKGADARMAKRILEDIEREARYGFLQEQERRLDEVTRLMTEAVRTGKPVWLGTCLGQDVWVTTTPPAPSEPDS